MNQGNRAATVGLIIALWGAPLFAQQSAGSLDRTVLPVQEPARPVYSEIDARNVAVPPRFEVKAPEGAPNVVIILIDDLGFGVPTGNTELPIAGLRSHTEAANLLTLLAAQPGVLAAEVSWTRASRGWYRRSSWDRGLA